MSSVAVEVQCDPGHQVELALFQLEALCYHILVYLYTVAPSGTAITVTSQVSAENLVVRFAAKMMADGVVEPFPGKREQVLLEALQGHCVVREDAVLLTLPVV
jgi:hypothetical protein